jgi:alpha-glucosidase
MNSQFPEHIWWQTGIIYQIYPLSFQDSGTDGIGDLPGILRRLDYLSSLNVTALWLSPIYPSPMRDFGYDVADYTAIHPWFGTLDDFDRLLDAVHVRGLRLILDLVPNHTSDEHPWFVASRSSRDHPKRPWYIWRDPAPDGGPPNNWLSFFGGPAWTYDERTGQYYLHQFTRQQPELNYRHPEVLEAMLGAMRFWLERGVDGFRVDVVWLLMKDRDFRDEPLNPQWDGLKPHGRLQHIYTANLPETHDVVRTMRAVIDGYGDRLMVGEAYLPNPDLMRYYGRFLDECHLPMNFQLISSEWRAREVRRRVDAYEAALPSGAWPNWVLGNHDQPRLASRVGPEQGRVAAMLLLTLRGTPTWYYGDELGMQDVPIPVGQMKDPQALNQPEIADRMSRDPTRTPMPWDASPHGGFTGADAEPWLPLAKDYPTRNVEAQSRDGRSPLALFRALTALRQRTPALMIGDYRVPATPVPDDIFAYLRMLGEARILVVLNFGAGLHRLDFSAAARCGELLLSTGLDRFEPPDLRALVIRPNEGVIIRLAPGG